MIRDKPKQYYLPAKWTKYLSYEPETGMGYQIADIYFKEKTLKNVIILGCSTFNHKNKKLDLSKIEKITIKEREEYEEIKKFQTISVKNTPTKEAKMKKYYLIEEYKTLREYDWGDKIEYAVTSYETKQQLLEAILNGPKHGGKLIPAKGLEVKIVEEEQYNPYVNTRLRDELAEDAKRREQAYRETGEIVDEKEIEKHRADHGVIS